MIAVAFLEQVWLAESETTCERQTDMRGPFNIEVEVEDLGFEQAGKNHVLVKAGLSFDLHHRERLDEVAYLEAAFRLLYRVPPITRLDEQRVFATTRALPDVWPVWRGWLHQNLALMGMVPTALPAQLPSQLVLAGSEAFDITRDVDKQLAAKARAHKSAGKKKRRK